MLCKNHDMHRIGVGGNKVVIELSEAHFNVLEKGLDKHHNEITLVSLADTPSHIINT